MYFLVYAQRKVSVLSNAIASIHVQLCSFKLIKINSSVSSISAQQSYVASDCFIGWCILTRFLSLQKVLLDKLV
jgi:hypothetical protein